jgi:hypothetical protein
VKRTALSFCNISIKRFKSYFFDQAEFESKSLNRAVDLQDPQTVAVVQGEVGGNPVRQLLRVFGNFDLES